MTNEGNTSWVLPILESHNDRILIIWQGSSKRKNKLDDFKKQTTDKK